MNGQGKTSLNSLGTYYFANGNKYIGKWKNGKIHGTGILYYGDGEKYEGEWANGKMNGKGE